MAYAETPLRDMRALPVAQLRELAQEQNIDLNFHHRQQVGRDHMYQLW